MNAQQWAALTGLAGRVEHYSGKALYAELLAPAMPDLQATLESLQALRCVSQSLPGQLPELSLNALFVLSVIDDYMASQMHVNQAQYQTLWQNLGMQLCQPEQFHPGLCEVVKVITGREKKPSVRVIKPALLWGDLVFSRARVQLFLPEDCHSIDRLAIVQAPLFFSHYRDHRQTEDLSQGWGHNSRWHTDFSRTYVCGDWTLFNVDGSQDIADWVDPRTLKCTPAMAREVLAHRSMISRLPSPVATQLWPYQWSYAALHLATAWPQAASQRCSIARALALLQQDDAYASTEF